MTNKGFGKGSSAGCAQLEEGVAQNRKGPFESELLIGNDMRVRTVIVDGFKILGAD